MFKVTLLILTVLFLSCNAANLPSWPKQFRWSWNSSNLTGLNCITIDEPGTPAFHANKLCWESDNKDPGFKWSWAGSISGMKCTRVYDPVDGNWAENFLCVPSDSPYDFTFHYGGKPNGRACINMNDPAVGGWADNFLCATVGSGPSF